MRSIASVDFLPFQGKPADGRSRRFADIPDRGWGDSCHSRRDVLPSQLRSRLNVADKSQRRRDLGKLGRRRKAFERRPDCGLRVGVAPS